MPPVPRMDRWSIKFVKCYKRLAARLRRFGKRCLDVGTVLFLRFINPAIVSPYEMGIVEKQPPQNIKRGLMLMSKILQNIANHVEFGILHKFT